MEKKKRFILASLFLMLAFFLSELLPIEWRYQATVALAVLTILTVFLIFRNFVDKGSTWLILWLLPVSFTISISLFYFLMPRTLLFLISPMFFLVIYVVFLTENVFLVSMQLKTVPLYRAAYTVGFLLCLLIGFFSFNTIFSFRLPFWLNGIVVTLASLPLTFFSCWSAALTEPQKPNLIGIYALAISLILGEVSLAISFWPLGVNLASLYLVSFFYIIVGLSRFSLKNRLFKTTIREFIWIGLGVFFALFLTTSWRGPKF